MADNPVLPATGSTVAADDISSVYFQRVKLTLGTDGVNDGDVSSSNPIPVAGAVLGAVGETAPASDTASSGLNGRLQRIAQRVTSLIALLPSALGPQARASSLSVVGATPPASYCASYRIAVAASDLALAFTFVANTDKHLATIYHTSGSSKTVKIRRISIAMATSVAGVFGFEVRRLDGVTAPATGNPAITPGKYNSSSGAAEAECLALPGTQGSVANVDTQTVTKHVPVTISTSAGNSNWATSLIDTVLYEFQEGKGMEPLTLRAGVAEGFAIVGRAVATPALRFTITIDFTEE